MLSDWPVEFEPVAGCWLWAGKVGKTGYPEIYDKRLGRLQHAHRVVYEAEVGPIPEDRELEHACKRRRCTAPAHLWLVTHRENMLLSGRCGWRTRAKRDECPQGHNLWREGVRTEQGGKVCKVCSGVRP